VQLAHTNTNPSRYEDISAHVKPRGAAGADADAPEVVELTNEHQLELMRMMKQGASEEMIMTRANELKQEELDASGQCLLLHVKREWCRVYPKRNR
jgi:hypothetical protein